eukprot:scaffold7359_cov255-Pinguiococcus_pyrenoidosus.AAC.26
MSSTRPPHLPVSPSQGLELVHHHRHGGQGPPSGRRRRRKLGPEDEGRAALPRLVHRAVVLRQRLLVPVDRACVPDAHGDDRHVGEHLLRSRRVHGVVRRVPPGALQVHPSDVRSLAIGSFDALGLHLLRHDRDRFQLVQLGAESLRVHLTNRREETHRVGEAADPGDLRRGIRQGLRPRVKLIVSLREVEQPRRAASRARPAKLLPGSGHAVAEQIAAQLVHLVTHRELAAEALAQLHEGALHLLDEPIENIELLVREALENIARGALRNLLRALRRGRAAGLPRLELHDGGEELQTLAGAEVDLGVGVQAESQRRLGRHVLLDVLHVLVVAGGRRGHEGEGRRRKLGEGAELRLVQEGVLHVEVQVGTDHDGVLVVRDLTAVHDAAEDVLEVVPRNLAAAQGVVHVVLQALGAVDEVSLREGVADVEAQREVRLALNHDGMEVAKAEENALHPRLGRVDVGRREGGQRPLQVGLEARRRLVGELDAAVENADGDRLAGVAAEEQAEARVGAILLV